METFATAVRPDELESWWIALGVVAGAALVGLLLRFVFVGRLRRMAARTATPVGATSSRA